MKDRDARTSGFGPIADVRTDAVYELVAFSARKGFCQALSGKLADSLGNAQMDDGP